jgi:hypothetical protein
MSVQNGDVVILQIGGVQVGALVSNSQNMSADMLDKTNKDTPGIKQYDAGEYGWTLSVEALWDPAATEGFSDALGYLKAGTEITVLHGISGTEATRGTGLISSIDVSGPKNEISSYSLEIQGTGVYNIGYGPVLNVSTLVNDGSFPYDTFLNATSTGFDAISDGTGASAAGTVAEIAIISGEQYFFEFDMVLNSGTAPNYNITNGLIGASSTSEGPQTAIAGSNAFTFTASETGNRTGSFINSGGVAGNFEITNLSIRQLL